LLVRHVDIFTSPVTSNTPPKMQLPFSNPCCRLKQHEPCSTSVIVGFSFAISFPRYSLRIQTPATSSSRVGSLKTKHIAEECQPVKVTGHM